MGPDRSPESSGITPPGFRRAKRRPEAPPFRRAATGNGCAGILKRSLFVSVGVALVCSTFLVAAGPWIIGVWVNHAVAAPFLLLVGLAIWKVLEAGGNSLAVFLNGARVVTFQVIVGSLTAVVGIFLKIWLVGHIGVAGVVWAAIGSFTIFSLLPILFCMKKLLKNI